MLLRATSGPLTAAPLCEPSDHGDSAGAEPKNRVIRPGHGAREGATEHAARAQRARRRRTGIGPGGGGGGSGRGGGIVDVWVVEEAPRRPASVREIYLLVLSRARGDARAPKCAQVV